MILLGLLAVGGIALANGGGPAAPTITVHPTNPTASTSASFKYTEEASSVSFICSLDGSAFKTCGSGSSGTKSYSGLATGSHIFRVEAVSGSQTSSPASYTWTIDLTAPSVTLSFPANGGSYNTAGWSGGCSGGAGICGTANDPSGVANVSVSLRQASTGYYWSGSSWISTRSELFISASLGTPGGTSTSWRYALALPQPDGSYAIHVRASDTLGNTTPSGSYLSAAFTIDTVVPPQPTISSGPVRPPYGSPSTSASFQFSDSESGTTLLCSIDGAAFAACTSPKSYSGLAQGSHTFRVEARDAAGNVSSAASWTFTVDTVPPNQPTLTQTPPNLSSSTSATFAWTDTDPAPGSGIAAYFCKLDSGNYQPCSSPKTYSSLALGSHSFSVLAIDWAGNISQATTYTWTIAQQGLPFTIDGNSVANLYPGAAAQAVAVTFHNPNSVPIFVTSLTVALRTSDFPAGCASGAFQITQASIPPAGVQVPANGSVTLPAQGATAPTAQMQDSGNQDACKSLSFHFDYTGGAHS